MSRLAERLGRPVDIAWLVAFRIFFGATMLVSMGRFLAYGWVDDFFTRPKLHFKYFGFAWIDVLPPAEMHLLFSVLALLALGVALGLFFRVCCLAFAVGFAYLQLVDVATYLNHYYLATLLAFLLALSPADRALSLDNLLRRRVPATHVPAAWLALFRFQLGVVYTFAGLAKAHADWLVHAQPLSIWLASRTGLPLFGSLFARPEAALVMSWAGFLFDTSVPWLLSFRRTRIVGYLAVLAFHAMTRLLFPIGMFPFIMVMGALVFFPPDWPRRLLARLRRSSAPSLLPIMTTRPRPVFLALGIGFCLVQLLLPLRYRLYGGNVLWHEQGMRFSWRVMVREKNGSVAFRVHQPGTGKVSYVSPRKYLTAVQERELSSQPDLILQLAHRIRDDFARRGHGSVEVYAETMVSLNGRPAVPLIDPNVDLARVTDGLGRARWILPAPTSAPPAIRPVLARAAASAATERH